MKSILFIILTIFVMITPVLAENASSRRDITGTADITVINPSTTTLKICTPNKKYSMESGSSETLRLFIRNDMKNKTVKEIYLDISADDGFTFSFIPDHLENIEPNENRYFDINVTVSDDVPVGNYRVNFLVGTDEYLTGAFRDEIMIRIRQYSNEMHYILGAVVIIIIIAFCFRFVWIIHVNRKAKQHKRKRKKKAVSQYYYKKKRQTK